MPGPEAYSFGAGLVDPGNLTGCVRATVFFVGIGPVTTSNLCGKLGTLPQFFMRFLP